MLRVKHGSHESDVVQAAVVARKVAILQRLLTVAVADIASIAKRSEQLSADASDYLNEAASACESAQLIAGTLALSDEDLPEDPNEICISSPNPQPVPPVTPEKASACREHARILLVEHEQFTHDVIRGLLCAVDVDVETARNDDEAIARLKESKFDAAIVDVTLPGSYGVDVASNIRKLHPRMPIALISGQTEYLDAIMGSGFECTATVRKPVRAAELCSAVERLLACASERCSM